MTSRKCIYTGREAKAKDSVIPRNQLNDEIHNWAAYAPCSEEYKSLKKDGFPTELEMQANEIFHLLELARLRVKFYEEKLQQIQQVIVETTEIPKIVKKDKKEEQIKNMIHEKEILENTSKNIDDYFEKKLKNNIWE